MNMFKIMFRNCLLGLFVAFNVVVVFPLACGVLAKLLTTYFGD